MDRHQSTIKRHRQSLKRRDFNRGVRSKIRTTIKTVELAETQDEAAAALAEAVKVLDRATGPRFLQRNKAARLKSRLTRMVASKFSG